MAWADQMAVSIIKINSTPEAQYICTATLPGAEAFQELHFFN